MTPAWWRRAFIMLCWGLYQPTRVDRVQHVLSWAEGSHNRAPTIISYIYFYYVLDISMLCWQVREHTPCYLRICSVHAQQQTEARWTNMNGAKRVVWPSRGAGFPSERSLLSWGHQCQSSQSPVIAGKHDTAVQGLWCCASHTMLPVANINNKTWYKRLKVSKTAHEERRRDQCMLSVP